MRLDAMVVDVQRRRGDRPVRPIRSTPAAPGQKQRVFLAAVDELEHLRRGEFDQDELVDFGHGELVGATTMTERRCGRTVKKILPHTDAASGRAATGRRNYEHHRKPQGPSRLLHRGEARSRHRPRRLEVKAIRAGRSNIKELYVVIRAEEIFVFGMHITPLSTASSHVRHDPTRTRKLLLHKKEIARLIGRSSAPAIRWCRSTCTTRMGS